MFVKLIVFVLTVRTTFSRIAHNKDLRIVGGKDGRYHKYPYVMRLETRLAMPLEKSGQPIVTVIIPRHSCSCTALTPIWTLTAGHCTPSKSNPVQLFIRYGSERPGDINSTVSKVLECKIHPSYRAYDVGNMPLKVENDVAVLNTEPIVLPFYGRLSAIEYSSLFGQKAIACGYGMTNDTLDKGVKVIQDTLTLNKPLQIVEIMMMRCTSVLTLAAVHPGVCMARRCGYAVAMCPGDSGGPLLHKSGIVGVTSLGGVSDCSYSEEKSNLVGVITAVSPFIEWIGNIING